MVLGSGQPSFAYNTVAVPFRKLLRACIWPFRYVVFSWLLRNDSDLRCHKWSFLDLVFSDRCGSSRHHHNKNWGCSGPRPEVVFAGTRQPFAEPSYHAYGSLASNYGVSQEMFFWRKRGKFRAFTFLYTHNPKIFTFSCGRSRLMLVIAGVTSRGTAAIASFL